VLANTIAWTQITLRIEVRRKRYGSKKVQGLDCEENRVPGAYLQETRDLDIIMHIISRFIP
jgi:hypothetical protein